MQILKLLQKKQRIETNQPRMPTCERYPSEYNESRTFDLL